MARTSLTLRNIRKWKLLRTEVNSHKTTLDALEAARTSNALKFYMVTGSNGAGQCTATGTAVGDVVIAVMNLTDATDDNANFEATITVVNKIVQSSASNLSAKKFLVVARTPVS
jgi:hypothetical protein